MQQQNHMEETDHLPRLSKSRSPEIQGDGNVIGDHNTVQVYKAEGGSTLIVQAFPPPPFGYRLQAPPLPRHFIPRPEASAPLKERLLSTTNSRHGALAVSALQGLGGIGKSTLAAALAYDPDIQAHFPDGVLWTTLGQQPEVTLLLGGWIQALGDYNFKPMILEATSAHLRSLLHDKACLLVIDDAWDAQATLPFAVGGERCRALITTRRADVADELNAELFNLDVMSIEQAMALLEARLEQMFPEHERSQAQALAQAVGYLPLAMELCAGRLQRGDSFADLISALQTEVARLEALEGPRRARLLASLNLSLDALRRDNPAAWKSFAWLGVLPEDATFAAPMVATLWQISPSQAQRCLELLWNDSLLLPASQVWIGDKAWHGYRIHDLMHDMARRLLTFSAPDGLGIELQQAHERLLERYACLCTKIEGMPEGRQPAFWSTLPDDGYVHAHLVWHMQQAGQVEVIHALLREETAEGKNGWYEACDHLGLAAVFGENVKRAWDLSLIIDVESTNNPADAHLGLIIRQVLYALITRSLASLAGNIPSAVLVQAVRQGLWTFTQGLAYAHMKPDPQERCDTLSKLAACAADEKVRIEILMQALRAVQQIEYEGDRTEILCTLAPELSGELLDQALEIAWQIKIDDYRVKVIATLASQLNDDKCQVVLTRTMENAVILDEKYLVQALIALVPHLNEIQRQVVIAQALQSAWRIKDQKDRIEALTILVPLLNETQRPIVIIGALQAAGQNIDALNIVIPQLNDDQRRVVIAQALSIASNISDEETRILTMSDLAPQLSEEQYQDVALQILKIVERNLNLMEGTYSTVISALAPRLNGSLLVRAMRTIQERSWYESECALALSALAPRLSGELLAQALKIARRFEDQEYRFDALSALALQLSEEQRSIVLAEALETARQIRNDKNRCEALNNLAPQLSEKQYSTVLAETLDVARHINDYYPLAKVLSILAPYISEEKRSTILRQALQVAQQIGNENERAEVLIALAPQLGEEQRPAVLIQALEAVQQFWNLDDMADDIITLVPLLSGELLSQALAIAQRIWDKGARAKVLTTLVPLLSEAQRPAVLSQALQAALEDESEYRRAQALEILAPQLIGESLRQALQYAQQIKDDDNRAHILNLLAPQLSGDQRRVVLTQALESALQINDERDRVFALSALAPQLGEAQRQVILTQALESALQINDERDRVFALSALAPQLGEAQRQVILTQALESALQINDERDRVFALSALAPQLGEAQRQVVLTQAMEAVLQITDEAFEYYGIGFLNSLTLQLNDVQRQVVLAQALKATLQFTDGISRASALTALAPQMNETQRPVVIEQALQTVRRIKSDWTDYHRIDALRDLAPLMNEEQHRAVLAELLETSWTVSKDRGGLFRAFTYSIRLMGSSGGEEMAFAIYRSIQDVVRWWP